MKKIGLLLISLVLVAVCLILLPTEAKAASESDLTFTLNSDGQSYRITDCDYDARGVMVIPTMYEGKPVTGIDDGVFKYCFYLTSITIPDTVVSIGDMAFYDCGDLKGIWVDEDNAYYSSDTYGVLFNKDKTELIQAPETISGQYEIPEGVTRIGDYAFCDCDALQSIAIPASIIKIGSFAFYSCDALRNVIYCGTQEQWDAIRFGSLNTVLTDTEPQFHSPGAAATCSAAQTCTICGEVLAAALDHDWKDASCSVCGVSLVNISDDGKIAANGDYDAIRVIYIGDEEFDPSNNSWNDLKVVGLRHTNINGANGYLTFKAPALPTLKQYGNYIIRVIYTESDGTQKAVNYATTRNFIKNPTPVVTVDGSGKVSVEGAFDTIRVVYTEDTAFDKNNSNWADLKAIGLNYANINGANGYRNYTAANLPTLRVNGNYIIRVVYTEADGSTVTANYAFDFVAYPPVVEMDANGKITVNGSYDIIRVVYIGGETFDVNNTDWAALKAVGMKYTYVNSANGYRNYNTPKLPTLKAEGNYILRVVYHEADGSKVTANYAFSRINV